MTHTGAIVYAVDDDTSIRKAMTRMFRSMDMQVETFANAEEFLAFKRPDVPGCLILDVHMPGQTGMELQAELAKYNIDLPIVFMTAHGDIPMTVKAMKAGAIDFLPKPVDDQQLTETVHRAIAWHTLHRQELAELQDFRRRTELLSKREYQVMTLVIEGLLNKQIARRLGITEYTVKVHRGRMMEKTAVDSVAELVRLCERTGIVSPDT